VEKQVSAAEHLCNDWSMYEKGCEETDKLLSEMEYELEAISSDTTDAEQLHTSYQRLQVCICGV